MASFLRTPRAALQDALARAHPAVFTAAGFAAVPG